MVCKFLLGGCGLWAANYYVVSTVWVWLVGVAKRGGTWVCLVGTNVFPNGWVWPVGMAKRFPMVGVFCGVWLPDVFLVQDIQERLRVKVEFGNGADENFEPPCKIMRTVSGMWPAAKI